MSRPSSTRRQAASLRRARPKRPMTDEMLHAVAARFHALSDPVRLRLLQALRDGPRIVTELARAVETSHANASKHLRLLADAGFVTRTPMGTSCRYALADDTTERVCAVMCDRVAARAEAALRSLGAGAAR